MGEGRCRAGREGAARLRRLMATGLLAALSACAPPAREPSPRAPAPAPLPEREPFVRVGLSVGEDTVRVAGSSPLRAVDLAAGRRLPAAGGGGWLLAADGAGRLRVRGAEGRGGTGPGGAKGEGGEEGVLGASVRNRGVRRVRFSAVDPDGTVSVGGRAYRGSIEVFVVEPHGLVVVNQLDLERYLRGVVPLEIGPRGEEEREAVLAQAVAARTYTIAHLGRRDSLGFDVFGGVLDQVYGGVSAEREEASRAVELTRGQILLHRGRPVRAYFHSTGGGHTARVTDVWELEDAPYLRRVSDRRPGGGDYCDLSPRYAWEARWSPRELRSTLERGLQERLGVEAGSVGEPLGLRVRGRTPRGRVTELEIRTTGGVWRVRKDEIRFVLRTPDGAILGSTNFRVVEGPERDGGLVVRGRGFGHGVGMCQWGAIGRARAGQDYRTILAHYYPGTELRTLY